MSMLKGRLSKFLILRCLTFIGENLTGKAVIPVQSLTLSTNLTEYRPRHASGPANLQIRYIDVTIIPKFLEQSRTGFLGR